MNAFLQKKDLHLSCEWNAAFIQLGNEKFCCTESLDRRSNLLTGILPARGCNVWKTFEGEMRKAYLRIQPRSPLSSPLSQGAVREWCGLNFCAALGGGHRVSHCAWCLSPHAVLFFFFFFFFLDWRSSLFGEAQRSSTMRGNPSSTLRGGGWKALGTLGRKPLDLKW